VGKLRFRRASDIGGNRTIAERTTAARTIAEIGLIEARNGGKAFHALFTLALRRARTVDEKPSLASLSESEKGNSCLTRRAFLRRSAVVFLPENYLGVAARGSDELADGRVEDRAAVRSSSAQRTVHARRDYSDDNPQTGR